jgi:hypothetical protein
MSDTELETLVDRLTRYALGKLRRLTVHGVRYNKGRQGPKGFDPGDFVNAAVEAYLSGNRPWNREANSTIEDHLKDAIDSHVSNIINSAEHRCSRAMSFVGKKIALEVEGEKHGGPSPAEWVADKEWSEAFCEAAFEAVKDDPIAIEVLDALQEGWTRKEAIELLGLTSDQFDAARKRINRRIERKCKNFFKEMVT